MTSRYAIVARLRIAALASVVLASTPLWALDLGDKMPAEAVKMRSVDGRDVTLGEAKGGKGTLVIFTCNQCPWVKAWEERIVAIGNAAQKQGIGVVAVNANDPKVAAGDGYEEMQKRAKERGVQYPYVVDATSGVARAFGATRTPEAFLFDDKGVLVYHGTIDDNAEKPNDVTEYYLRDATDALVAGREIPNKETKALGCTIKFRPES